MCGLWVVLRVFVLQSFSLRAVIALSSAYFGEGSGSTHINFIKCSSSDKTLTECVTKSNGKSNHSLDAGVKCQPGTFSFC